MTSISAYRVFRTHCCHLVAEEPTYSSANGSTIFDHIEKFHCECGRSYGLDELEFVGVRKMSIGDLALYGVSEISIPAFLRKPANGKVVSPLRTALD
jgi:hypothetical protein